MSSSIQRKLPSQRAFTGLAGSPLAKVGRPPINQVAMTTAERKVRSRAIQKAKRDDAERRNLIARLVKIYDRQAMDVVVTGRDQDAIARAEDRRGADRKQKRLYLDHLMTLSLDQLRLAAEGKNTPDSRGKLLGESTGGRGSAEVETIIEATYQDLGGTEDNPRYATPTRPEGPSPDNPENAGKPSRWARVSAKELERHSNVEKKFREMATAMVDSNGHCHAPDWCMYDRTPCQFVASSSDAAVEHLWAEYYAGEKLWDKVDQLSDPDIVDVVGPLLIEARKKAAKAIHHWVISRWLTSRG
jgi:hypothetical protein